MPKITSNVKKLSNVVVVSEDRKLHEDELWEPIEIVNCRVIKDSQPGYLNQGALLVRHDGEECWIPKKLIDENSEVYNATTAKEGVLIIPEWLAIDKELV